MESQRRYLLFKFGKREHMERLFNQGELHLNTLKYFRDLENNLQRKDPREGIEKIEHRIGGKLFIVNPNTQSKTRVADLTRSELRFQNSVLDALNIYSLYIMDISQTDSGNIGNHIPEDMIQKFGDAAVVIYNDQEFIRRFEKAVPEGFENFRKVVNYKPLNGFCGEVGPFVKDIFFEHQKELRLAVHNPNATGTALKICLGPINDIAVLLSAHNIKELSIEWL